MNWIDIGIIALLGISLVYSLLRGFVKELFSLASIIMGFFMASQFYQYISYYLSGLIRNSIVTDILGFIIIFIVTAILVSYIGKFIRRLLRKGKTLTFIDRLAGGMLGILKGVLILSLILIPINNFPFLRSEMALRSRLVPYFMAISRELTNFSFSKLSIGKKLEKLEGNTTLKGVKDRLSQEVELIKKTFKKKEVLSLIDEDISEDDKTKLEKLLKDSL